MRKVSKVYLEAQIYSTSALNQISASVPKNAESLRGRTTCSSISNCCVTCTAVSLQSRAGSLQLLCEPSVLTGYEQIMMLKIQSETHLLKHALYLFHQVT